MFDGILSVINGSPRIVGDNDITVIGDVSTIPSFSLDHPLYKYGAGLLTPLYFMVFTLIVWSIYNCVTCCVDLRCFKNSALIPPLVVTSVIFIITLSLATVGMSMFTSGIEEMFQAVDDLITLIDAVLLYGGNIGSHADSAMLLIQAAETPCNATFPSFAEDVTTLKNTIQEIDDSVEPIKDAMKDLEDQFNSYVNMVEIAVISLTIVLYVTLSFYVATSITRVYKPEWKFNRYANKTVGVVVNTVGITAIFLTGIVVSLIAAGALAGSDLCVPGVDPTFNKLIANMDTSVTPSTLCSTSPYDLLCYYQTCEGGDPLGPEYTNIETAMIDFQTAVQDLIDGIPGASETCVAELTAAKDKFGEIGTELLYIKGSLSCTVLNPVYRRLMDKVLCQEIIKGLAAVYVLGYTAVITFLVVLTVQFLLDFRGLEGGYSSTLPDDSVRIFPIDEKSF